MIEHVSDMQGFDDDTREADAAVLHYEPSRRQVLEGVDWRFASRIIRAAKRADAPDFRGLCPVQLDPDVIRVHEVPGVCLWRVEGGMLYADLPAPLTYRATVDILDPTRHAPSFDTALVYLLAHRLAPVVTTSANRAGQMLANFEAAIEQARMTDSIEASPPSWTEGNTGGWGLSMAGTTWSGSLAGGYRR